MTRLRLVEARSSEEIARAAEFRRQVFLDRRRVSFDDRLETRRDREGHVFLLLEGSRTVATGRVLPYPSRLSPVLGLCQDLRLDADSEVGRIAAVRSPSAASHALVLLALGSAWVLRNTRRRRYVAYCHPKLVDLYRALGAEDVGGELVVPGRSEPHRIVSGSFEDAASLGASQFGITDGAETLQQPLRLSA
jgi:hypothetical protein